jgi:hypothetical protein
MEAVSAAPLPDLQSFLPVWAEKLRSVKSAARDWEDAHDRRLREAVTRAEGVPGLGRLARTSRRPEVVRAWCEAVRETGDWKDALRAYEEATQLVSSPVWRGDFLDGAALAAERLGLQDRTERLEVAFRQAPSLVRMLRWLTSDEPGTEALRKRASSMLRDARPKSPSVRGVLHLVAADIPSAAAVLAKAPGLGWSDDGHPGHHLFRAFATLLGVAAAPAMQPLDEPDLLDQIDGAFGSEGSASKLSIPSFADVLRRSSVASALTPADRAAMRDAMRAAAITRVDGVLGDKRRRQYVHAAALVACCAELDQRNGSDRTHSPDWVATLRRRTSRFPAFQTALSTELARRVGRA